MHIDTAEQKVMANVAKRVVEDLHRVEGGLRALATLTAAGGDNIIKTALQGTFRKTARSLATVVTELRLANDFGSDASLKVAAPAAKYDELTEEQQKVLKELQKSQAQESSHSKIIAKPYRYQR
jgi:hypothetical protein